MNNCKKCGAEILEDAKFCNECGAKVEREESHPVTENTVTKKNLILAIAIVSVFICFLIIAVANEIKEDNKKEDDREEIESVESWRDNFDSELVDEIESAFAEIGENPDNIINVEYVDTHTSGYVFEQKCYKVEFSWSLFNPGYEHSRYYRIVTQEYYDGEPEKKEYPGEFLCTIKYWVDDDGHGTNVNQWSWTGTGKKQ